MMIARRAARCLLFAGFITAEHSTRPLRRVRSVRPGRGIGRILVAKVAGQQACGKLILGAEIIPCALGRSGITRRKREGDGATPAGSFGIVEMRMRGDRVRPVRGRLPRRLIAPRDGWCDDPGSALYNRPIRLPSAVSHEALWRADGLYDVVLTLDYNLRRPSKGRGSAIFFHLAREDWQPTQGCVAIRRDAMRRLIGRLSPSSRLVVG